MAILHIVGRGTSLTRFISMTIQILSKRKYVKNEPVLRNIKLGSWNIHWLYSLDKSKLSDTELIDSIRQLDICALLETWMSPTHNPDLFEIEGYYIYNKRCRTFTKCRGSGGISICIKMYIKKGVKIIDTVANHCMWLKIYKTFFGNQSDIYIGVWYIPPNSQDYY